jgi:LuxR family maltose regulon positive regulatory protein
MLAAGRFDTVAWEIEAAEQILKNDGDRVTDTQRQRWRSELVALQANLACYRGEVASAADLSLEALELIPREDKVLQSRMANLIALNLGGAIELEDDLATATRDLTRAATLGDVYAAATSTVIMAVVLMRQARLHEAATTFQRVLQLIHEKGEKIRQSTSLVTGIAYLGLGELEREWNDLDAATDNLERGINLVAEGGDLGTLMDGYLVLARTALANRDDSGAWSYLDEAERLAMKLSNTPNTSWIHTQMTSFRARFWLIQGDRTAAARWVRESGIQVSEDLDYRLHHAYATLARFLTADNRPGEALELLVRLLDGLEETRMTASVIELLSLQAVALNVQNKSAPAANVLARALSLAKPGGYTRLFVDEGAPMEKALRKIAKQGVEPDYVDRLLRAFAEIDDQIFSRPQALIEPLSSREVELLRLVAAGLSNREIAEELIISLNTVKWHSKNIYGKLQVHSRVQAIARAHELGLIKS